MNLLEFIKRLLGWRDGGNVIEFQNTEEDVIISENQNFTPAADENPFAPKKDDDLDIEIKIDNTSIQSPNELIVDETAPSTDTPLTSSTSEEPTSSLNSSDSPDVKNRDGLSLLENRPFMSLSESVCSVIEKIDSFMDSADSTETKKYLKFIKHKLFEAFNGTGANTISDDTVFDGIRHAPVGEDLIKRGEPIEIVENGLSIEERTMILAKVKPLKTE